MGKQVHEDMLRSIGAEGHQSFAALHYVEGRGYHMHVAINRVNPTNLKVLNEWSDFAKLERACEWAEREFGLVVDRHSDWRRRVGEYDLNFALEGIELGESPERAATKELERSMPISIGSKTARARQHFAWAEIVRQRVAPAMRRTITKPEASASDLFANLRVHGLRIERREYAHPGKRNSYGYAVTGPERGQHISLRDLGFQASELERRFGSLEMPAEGKGFGWRAGLVRRKVTSWKTWDDANRELTGQGVGIVDLGGGRAQLVDLVAGKRIPLAGKRGLDVSLADLILRLGPFVASAPMSAIILGDQKRRLDGVEAAGKLLAGDPGTIVKPIAANQSTWTREEVTRAVRLQLGLKQDEEEEIVCRVVDAVLGNCELIDGIYTTFDVRNEERAMFDAAATLGRCKNGASIGEAGPDLDAQQRAAFAHLGAQTAIAIVTGVAGAGKSRLLREFARAHEGAGSRVIGIAVSGKAARVLGREAEVDARTLARLLRSLDNGTETLTDRDVIILDEASAVGTEQARKLFEYAVASGAQIRLLGDDSQHQSVGRGAVLRGLIEDHGCFDMAETRRANHSWMREMATDLRKGQVGKAFDKLDRHGCIHAYATTSEAHAFLAREFLDSRAQTVMLDGRTRPHEALLIADTTEEMAAMNRVVQQQLLEAEALGEGRELRTVFGMETFYVNDLVTVREARTSDDGRLSWVNGDTAVIVGHGTDGVLKLRHTQSGRDDDWDLKMHGGVQLGYAVTSFRGQGETVDTLLMSPAANLRGTYVDITRARERVVMAYGEDRIEHLGRAMQQAQRENGKTLVRDAQRNVAQRARREAWRSARESQSAELEKIKSQLGEIEAERVKVKAAKVSDGERRRERSHNEWHR